MRLTKEQYEIARDFIEWSRQDTTKKRAFIIGSKYTTQEEKQEAIADNERELQAINILLQALNDSEIM